MRLPSLFDVLEKACEDDPSAIEWALSCLQDYL